MHLGRQDGGVLGGDLRARDVRAEQRQRHQRRAADGVALRAGPSPVRACNTAGCSNLSRLHSQATCMNFRLVPCRWRRWCCRPRQARRCARGCPRPWPPSPRCRPRCRRWGRTRRSPGLHSAWLSVDIKLSRAGQPVPDAQETYNQHLLAAQSHEHNSNRAIQPVSWARRALILGKTSLAAHRWPWW